MLAAFLRGLSLELGSRQESWPRLARFPSKSDPKVQTSLGKGENLKLRTFWGSLLDGKLEPFGTLDQKLGIKE